MLIDFLPNFSVPYLNMICIYKKQFEKNNKLICDLGAE